MGKKIIIGILIIVLLIVASLFWALSYVRTEHTDNNVETMNSKIEDEINKLFVEDQRFVFYLPNRQVKVGLGEIFGAAFGIKNLLDSQRFTWKIYVNDSEVYRKCNLDGEDAENWIIIGKKGFVDIQKGEVYTDIFRIKPMGSTLDNCRIRFGFLVLDENGEEYSREPFDVVVK